MKRFKSLGQAQRFLATHDQVANLFRTPTTATADHHRQARRQAHKIWAEVAMVAVD
jgi:putative transposase